MKKYYCLVLLLILFIPGGLIAQDRAKSRVKMPSILFPYELYFVQQETKLRLKPMKVESEIEDKLKAGIMKKKIRMPDGKYTPPNFVLKGSPSLTLTQTAFSNWAAGGANSIASVVSADLNLLYTETNFSWETKLDCGYGLTYQDKQWFKNNDKLDLSTKFGLRSSKHWFYSLLFQLRTQFDKGYAEYPAPDKSKYTSHFMAPGYFIGSLGMDYKPSKEFSFMFSPVSAKCTFVLDSVLSNKGSYGVIPGGKALSEVGSLIKITYYKTYKSGSKLSSTIQLFSSWTHEPQNIDFSFEFDYVIKINKWFSSRFYTKFLYDDDIKTKKKDGTMGGAKLQFKQILGIGVAVSFS